MAASPRSYYRNYTSTDTTRADIGNEGDVVLTPEAVGFSAPAGKTFVNWNTNRDGTGVSVEPGISSMSDTLYAIWLSPPAVEITYNGDTIATMDDTGTKTLLTADTYCEDDIVVSYTTPDPPEPNLQTKTVSPTTAMNIVRPDSGYDGLASVTVNPIVPTKGAETYTPTTADQTIPSGRWLAGNQTIKGDANLLPANIKKNVSIFSVVGTYEGGGGGSSSYTQLASVEQAASTTSTSSTNLVWVTAATNYDKWEYVRIRDKAGKRNGYFYGSDTIYPPNSNAAGTDATRQALRIIYRVENGEVLSRTGQSLLQTGGCGVFPSTRNAVGVQIQTKVDSNYAPIIDGTYTIEVYELDDPSGMTPLE